MILNINTSATIKLVAQLGKISRSALPVAVRQTLTAAAFDVKQKTMPESSDVFIHRKPTFFQSNSRAEAAKGFDINSMRSTVGFIPKPDAKDSSVSDLKQQEDGGNIDGRSFIPLKEDRVGGKWFGNVRAAGRYREFSGKIFDSKDSPGSSDKEKFIRAGLAASQRGGVIIGNKINRKGNKIAWIVSKQQRVKSNTEFKLKRLFSVKADREVRPPATHFMKKASVASASKMELFFIGYAEKKINSLR